MEHRNDAVVSESPKAKLADPTSDSDGGPLVMSGIGGAWVSTSQEDVAGGPPFCARSRPCTEKVCTPSARATVEVPAELQGDTVLPSSLQVNDVASPSCQANCPTVTLVGLAGTVEKTGEPGAVRSTVHVTVPAVLRLPIRSTA